MFVEFSISMTTNDHMTRFPVAAWLSRSLLRSFQFLFLCLHSLSTPRSPTCTHVGNNVLTPIQQSGMRLFSAVTTCACWHLLQGPQKAFTSVVETDLVARPAQSSLSLPPLPPSPSSPSQILRPHRPQQMPRGPSAAADWPHPEPRPPRPGE